MNIFFVFVRVLVVIAAMLVVVGSSIVTIRVKRRWQSRRIASIVEPLRPALIELACEDDPDDSCVDVFLRLPPSKWEAVRPTVLDLCRKLSSVSGGALSKVLVQRGEFGRAMRDVTHRSPVVRATAAGLLELMPSPGSRHALSELVSDRDPDVRKVAVRALGRIGDESSVGPIIEALTGARRLPPTAVGHCLIRLGPIAVNGLETVIRSHPSSPTRALAADVLGHIGDPRVVPALIDVVESNDEAVTPLVRLSAIVALGRLGSPQSVDALLAGLDADRSPEMTVACLAALDDSHAAVPMARLTELLERDNARVVQAAARALVRLGPKGESILRWHRFSLSPAGSYDAEALALADLVERDRTRPLQTTV